jgi:glycosyltransferase involved in cell wall biosynthesis
VVVGKAQWRASDLYARVEGAGLQKQVKFTGYVPDEDLVLLYSSAELVVYPSIYEGFGLPILEAMSCGRPVITSRSSSIPEVAGNAALLVDPLSIDELATAISSVLNSRHLRRELTDKGIARAAQFTWRDTAQRTWAVYREVVNGLAPA